MRISTLQEDPLGYRTLRDILDKRMSVRVFLDGDQVRPDLVIAADSQSGMILAWLADDRGRITRAVKQLAGKVQFKIV